MKYKYLVTESEAELACHTFLWVSNVNKTKEDITNRDQQKVNSAFNSSVGHYNKSILCQPEFGI